MNAIDRLLGPADWQVTCEECFALLDQYVDLELAGEDAAARFPRDACTPQGCPACHEDHESLREFVVLQSSNC